MEPEARRQIATRRSEFGNLDIWRFGNLRPRGLANLGSYSPPVPRCRADNSIQRIVKDGFAFPLGVYPVEELTPRPGYSVDFEPADGDDNDGQWEAWPDRYVFEIVISAERLEPLCRSLLA